MLGGSSTIYNMRGIASAASSAAQTGTTYFTTTDSNGNLATSAYGSQDIATLQTQTTTNTNNIATNTTNITTSGQTTATALGGGSSYTPSGGVTAPSYNINGTTYNNVGSALSAVSSGYNNLNNNINSLGQATMSGFSNAYGQINNNQKEARQGIAMAAAMSQAPMPSAPGKTSWKLNNAIYKNAAATSLSVAHRLPTTVPVAVTAGVAIGLKNSAIVTGGMQGEF